MERTLVVLKPDAVERGIVGDIITRFEKVGLKIVATKMIRASEELADRHYPKDRTEFITGMGQKTLDNYSELGMDPKEAFGEDYPHKIGLEIQRWLVKFLTAGPVIALVVEGPHAIEMVRKICGFTLPSAAAPGTIRGDFSFDSSSLANAEKRPIKNLVHASGEKEEADYEIGLWFEEHEIYDYDTIHQKHMKG